MAIERCGRERYALDICDFARAVFEAEFEEGDDTFDADFGDISFIYGGDVSEYEGPYVVKPTVDEQVLPTAKKALLKDLVVQEIPFAVVSNNSGGLTATIGG